MTATARSRTTTLNFLEEQIVFSLPKEVESSCPHCPVKESAQFIEHMYRQRAGSWLQLEDYCSRLKSFREATQDCSDWLRQTLAKIAGIPDHHVNSGQV